MTGDPTFSAIASVLRCCMEKAAAGRGGGAEADSDAGRRHKSCAAFLIPLLKPSPTRHRARARGLLDSGLHGLRRIKDGMFGAVRVAAERVAPGEAGNSGNGAARSRFFLSLSFHLNLSAEFCVPL